MLDDPLKKTSNDGVDIKSEITRNWFVFYTAPRAEKVVYQELINRKYEAFLPVTKTLRIWKNRQKKMIEIVLFPSYIFVKTQKHELSNIIRIPKITSFIHFAGKPAIIPFKDIERIEKMLSLNQNVTVETNFNEGEKVRIVYGPLAGFEGILIKQKGKTRFGIELKEINQTMFIDICTTVLEKKEYPVVV